MKNQVFSLLILSCLPFTVLAQSSGSEQAVNEACRCLERIEYETGTHDIQAENCLINAVTEHYNELLKAYGYPENDFSDETGEQLGMDFGLELVAKCPAFLTYSLKSMEMSLGGSFDWGSWGDDDWLLDEDWSNWSYNDPISATVQYVDRKGLLLITALDDEGFQHNFIVLSDFQGSETLIKGNPTGKRFTFFYEEWEIYDPTTDAFELRKVIYGLE